jgi:hypothetical protein
VKMLMIISNSFHILWSISHFRVMWRLVISFFWSIDSFSKVVKLPPLSIWFSLRIYFIIPLYSFLKLVMDKSLILNIIDLLRSMVMS